MVHIREVATGEGATARPMEDEITIKSAESRLVVERGKIARIVGAHERAQRRSDRGAVSILDIRVLGDPDPSPGDHARRRR